METSPKNSQIQELERALLELNAVKRNAKVYKKQQNSNIFFLSDIGTLKADVQEELNSLQSKESNADKEA